jgi:hypothetical protein
LAGGEKSARRYTAKHDDYTDESRKGIMHENEARDYEATGYEYDRRDRKPPAPDRVRCSEQRGGSEREKQNCRKDNVGEDPIECSKQKHGECKTGL